MSQRTLRLALIVLAVLVVAGGAVLLKLRLFSATPAAQQTPDTDPAAVEQARVKQQLDAMIAETKSGVAADPKNPDAHFRLAQAYAAANNLEEAIASLKRCLDLDPKYIDAHLALGQMYQELGYFDRAHDHLQAALDLQPNNVGALVAMGELFFRFADGYAPMPYLLHAEQLASQASADNQVTIQMDLTMAYYLQTDFKSAQAHIEKAVQLAPDNALAMQRLGVLYYSTNQFAQARDALQRVLTMSQDSEQQIEARKSLAKVELRDPKGSPQEAMTWLQQLSSAGYSDAEMEFLVGEAYRRQNQPQEAIKHYEIAVGGKTPYPDAYRPLAELYRQMGRKADADQLASRVSSSETASTALRDLSARIARNPKQPELWLRLADALHQQGLDGYSIFYLRRGLAFNPGDKRLHRALADRYTSVGRGADAERERAAAQ